MNYFEYCYIGYLDKEPVYCDPLYWLYLSEIRSFTNEDIVTEKGKIITDYINGPYQNLMFDCEYLLEFIPENFVPLSESELEHYIRFLQITVENELGDILLVRCMTDNNFCLSEGTFIGIPSRIVEFVINEFSRYLSYSNGCFSNYHPKIKDPILNYIHLHLQALYLIQRYAIHFEAFQAFKAECGGESRKREFEVLQANYQLNTLYSELYPKVLELRNSFSFSEFENFSSEQIEVLLDDWQKYWVRKEIAKKKNQNVISNPVRAWFIICIVKALTSEEPEHQKIGRFMHKFFDDNENWENSKAKKIPQTLKTGKLSTFKKWKKDLFSLFDELGIYEDMVSTGVINFLDKTEQSY